VAHYVTLMRWTTQGYAGLPKWRELEPSEVRRLQNR